MPFVNIKNKVWHIWLKRPYKLVKSVDIGNGEPMLLIHGLASSGNSWKPFVDQVNTKKWNVAAYDLLGFGQSPKPDHLDYSVDVHVTALYNSLDKKFKRQKFIIIGHSMGCLVASHFAFKYPDLVKHLILYEPPLFADSPEFRSHVRRRNLYFALYKEMLNRPQMLFKYSQLASKLVQGRVLSVDEETWKPFELSLKNTIMKQRAYTELKKINVKTDIIYGKFDLIVTRAEVKKMLSANKCITFHLVNEMHDITKRSSKYINNLLEKLY